MYKPIENSGFTPRNDISINLNPTLEQGRQMLRLQLSESGAAKYEHSDDDRGLASSHNLFTEKGSLLHLNAENELTSIYRESQVLPENEESSKPALHHRSNSLPTVAGLSAGKRVGEIRPIGLRPSVPPLMCKRSEETIRNRSMELELSKTEKEPASAGVKSAKQDNGTSFMSDIVITRKRGANDDQQKSSFMKRSSLLSKSVTISLPFDYFVDQVKGREPNSIESNYPSYKIDKRLIFLGKEVDFPWHLISYNSTFRRLWNLFIIALITYQIFWYPLATAFLINGKWPTGSLIFELVCILIFFIDILVNIRTTYSNENNEEIIDSKMMRTNYMKSSLFIVDLITTLPIPEILLLILINSSSQWEVYSWVVLIRMLRILKIPKYFENRTLSVYVKLIKIFATFFIIVHWVSCIWYLVINAEYRHEKKQYPDLDDPDLRLWFPNNMMMVTDDHLPYYTTMDTVKVYGYTLLSVFMLAVGSDMAPVSDIEIWMSVCIGLFGAVGLAYTFAIVTLTINRAYQESSLYQQQLEELKDKLRINKIPYNLRLKVMEYFYYSWRKHRVLKKMDDFSELSIPLQRDIALYQHQEMILKVPLFKELDPVEILSIVQKLKTAIYMPGDKIIREGERGTEMFFIQEGVVEVLIKTASLTTTGTTKPKYEKLTLEKGAYFGEVALMSNSRRTADVNAYEFCILYSFSRSDYNNLKNEFKDIGPRLRSGLKHYKNTHMASLIQILKNLDIFQGFTEKELRRIGDEYLEEIFVDPDKVILGPKNRINAIYVMLGGNVNCYLDTDETKNYLNHLKRSDNKDNWTIVDMDEEEDIDCLDDDILKLEKDKLSMEDQKKKLDLVKAYSYGDYFGTLDFDVNEIKCTKYYVSDTGCQIGVITQSLKSQMANEDPILYKKLEANIIKLAPKRVIMGAIEEESDSSFTTKNNTIVKTKLSRKTSITELGKRPILIKVPSLVLNNKEEDLNTIREDLQQIEDEMNHFRNLVGSINAKLNRITFGMSPGIRSIEGSPDKHNRAGFKSLTQAINQARTEKQIGKELAKELIGVDEEDQAEESKSIRLGAGFEC